MLLFVHSQFSLSPLCGQLSMGRPDCCCRLGAKPLRPSDALFTSASSHPDLQPIIVVLTHSWLLKILRTGRSDVLSALKTFIHSEQSLS